MRTVISMCGKDGTGGPWWVIAAPAPYRAPASSRPETNWDDEEASTVTAPPGTVPWPRTVNGTEPVPSSSISAPSSRSASRSGRTGRWAIRGSPVNRTSARARAAAGGTKRSTVPALPTSMPTLARSAWPSAGGPAVAGSTRHSRSPSVMRQPSACSAPAIRRVSLAASGPVISVGESASAAMISARLVIDLEPGSLTTARTGPAACGAVQSAGRGTGPA